jgi:hypothetical protein
VSSLWRAETLKDELLDACRRKLAAHKVPANRQAAVAGGGHNGGRVDDASFSLQHHRPYHVLAEHELGRVVTVALPWPDARSKVIIRFRFTTGQRWQPL